MKQFIEVPTDDGHAIVNINNIAAIIPYNDEYTDIFLVGNEKIKVLATKLSYSNVKSLIEIEMAQ